MVKITPTVPFSYRSDQGEHDRLDRMLDMALDLTFPGSDPVAITISTNENRKMQACGTAKRARGRLRPT